MDLQTLTVKTRTGTGKGDAKRSRNDGHLPAVLYGGEGEPLKIAMSLRDLERLLHGQEGSQAVVQLDVENAPELSSPALLKMVQWHPIKEHPLHVDFLRIRLDQRIQTTVHISLVGQCKGVTEGGVLDQQLREIEVECLALDVPEHIDVDVTDLAIGEGLHVAQLAAMEGITILTDPDRSLVAVHMPRVVEEPVEEEEGEGEEGEEGEGEEGEGEEEEGEGEAGKDKGRSRSDS